MDILGKLAASGSLTDIFKREPIVWTDGSTEVPLVEIPTFDGPFSYDAVNQVAIPNPVQQSLDEQVQALQTIINGFGIQVPMETVDDIVTTAAVPIGLAGLGFGIKPNENWHGQWTLYCRGSAGGMKFGVTGPAAPISVKFSADGNTTAVTERTVSFVTAYNVLTASAFVVNSTVFTGKVQIDMHIANGPNAGTVQLGFGSAVNGQSNMVIGRSFGRSWRAAV